MSDWSQEAQEDAENEMSDNEVGGSEEECQLNKPTEWIARDELEEPPVFETELEIEEPSVFTSEDEIEEPPDFEVHVEVEDSTD